MLNIKLGVGVAFGAAVFYLAVFMSNAVALSNGVIAEKAKSRSYAVASIVDLDR